ncbi:hypothetical protein CLU86_3049 [Acidovorax sp. 62]|uniref:hypothetical protein n=1 Tax=Acidovorax sp. 62 TaxID=2035203 RepID=UPI000C59E118|nr:hypothetical protein [Acidovorax sp. 62]PIF92109.1 hypothetical protein CLU86_3049 [Acidovorax sp. 62]
MGIHINIPSAGTGRHQPIIKVDRAIAETSKISTSATSRPEIDQTRATFSAKALSLSNQQMDANDPDSVRAFLSNFDFRNISPADLAYVGSTLAEAGVIEDKDAFPLIGTELTYEQPLDRNKAVDSFKIFDDTLATNIAAGPTALAGRDYHVRAADFIRRLDSFASSDRSEI